MTPTRFRSLLGACGGFVLVGGLAGLAFATQLSGWVLLRGIGGGLIACAVGLRLLRMAIRQDWPDWLASVLGDDSVV